ncbi:MAG: hypothetical protein FWH01_08500 [Oscillospiraceae bacterium]|nr:hypothetical protein [Oscillospiraceae bacterium]
MRKTAVRISIIGAGSATFSAGIVRDLCVCGGLEGSHIVFMDIDEKRLGAIAKLGAKIAGELSTNLVFSCTTDRREALKGADYVINTVQVKANELDGHDWVETQRSLAEKHGYYRGIRLHNLTQMHFMLELANDIKEICPGAWLLQSGNPVFEGCTFMHRAVGINVIGLCHGHYGYRHVARVLGLDSADVTAQMTGFNHWIWMTDFRHQGRDAYPLLDQWIADSADAYWADDTRRYSDVQMSRGAIHQYKLFGLMPIGDTPRMVGWWYHTDLETKKRWFGSHGGFDSEIGWAQYLKGIGASLERVENAANSDARATDIFKPVQSGEQIVPIINALTNDVEGVYQVNIPNKGRLLDEFPENVVVEGPGLVNGAGVFGIKARPLPATVVAGAMIPRWREAEQLVECMRLRSYNLLKLLVLSDARTRSLEQAENLIDEWLSEPHNTRLANYFS